MFGALKDRLADSVRGIFPIVGKRNVLELQDLRYAEEPDLRDVESQLRARLDDETWGVPLIGRLRLRDAVTGKIRSSAEIPLATLPTVTAARGYIVDGREYYANYLWKGRPGVFTYPKARGVVSSIAAQERSLNIEFDPAQRSFKLRTGGSAVPLKPVLQALGISNAAIAKTWGTEISKANDVTGNKADTALAKLGRSLGKPSDPANLREALTSLSLDPEITKLTLGKEYKKVTPEVLLAASKKALTVARGQAEPDDRDSLPVKKLIGVDDHLSYSVQAFGQYKARSLKNAVDRHDQVDRVIRPNMFHSPIRTFFTGSPLSQLSDQTNPLAMMRSSMQSTILGESGSSHALEHSDAKSVNPSHVAFVDPLDTPEGQNVGVNLQLSLGLMKDGNTPKTLLYNLRKKKFEPVDPVVFESSTVALPDQYRKKGGKYVPAGKKVRVSGPGNKFVTVDSDKVEYVVPHPGLLLGAGTSLVPFVQNTNPGRVEMASRHMSQAIPLVQREAPLVQVAADPDGQTSFEEVMGTEFLPTAPVSGKVTSVKDGEVTIRDSKGKAHKVRLYQNYPLTGKRELIHEEPRVKKGQTVRKGDPLADSNFTDHGTLALGTNVRAALMPIPGRTYEDSLVMSEGGARKLTSVHLHKVEAIPDEQEVVGPKRFQAYYPTAFTKDQYGSVDESGVVKPGSVVKPGDPLVLGLRPVEHTNESLAMKKMHRSLAKPYHNAAVTWDQDVAGEVVRVHRTGAGSIKVHVRTQEPLQVGDKITTRFGIKGIVVDIRPDEEMPRTAEGPIELAINPHGVAARVAAGQVYELAAGKVAKKLGKPLKVPNFQPDLDYGEYVRDLLDKNGVSEEEEVIDPTTGRVLGKAAVGYTTVLKQQHQVDRKMAARAGGSGFSYDVNKQPKGGKGGGAQSIGGLGNMALLSHGARSILQESRTWKTDADQADELWRRVQLGQSLPPPRLTFAHKKFEEYLKGLGVRLEKKGTRVKLIPTTDEEVVNASHGELKRPGLMLRADNLKPETGGLFDPAVTGGIMGEHAAHISLAEPLPNPFFERGVLSLTGLKQTELHDVIAGKAGVGPDGKLVDRKTPGAQTGGRAIQNLLDAIDPKKEAEKLKEQIATLEGAKLDKAVRRYRYLTALQETGLSPSAAYMTQKIHVIPPSMRPMTVLPSGALIRDSLNELYKGVGVMNERLENMDPDTPEFRRGRARFGLYQTLGSLAGVMEPTVTTQGATPRGFMDAIAGVGSPKSSWVQSKLLKSRQDLAARSTIIPDPDLTVDEVGIPLPIAKNIYRPFVVRNLTRMGHGALQAQEMLKREDPVALRALEKEMDSRPVLMKRDPVLHRYGVQAFKPHITSGRAIRIPPLITESMGADFDGDQVSLYVPVSGKAVEDAHRMFPSENLLNPATGKPVFAPRNEMLVGLYRLSQFGKDTGRTYKTMKDAVRDATTGQVGLSDVIKIGGKETTAGRLLVWKSLPESARTSDLLFNRDYALDRDRTDSLLADVAKKDKKAYVATAQALMNLGNAAVYEDLFSISSADLRGDKELRDRYMKAGEKAARAALASNAPDREEKAVAAWADAGKKMFDEYRDKAKKSGNRLYAMTQAGVKPSNTQFQELTLAPVLMMDSKGRPILEPVTKSYGEGLDLTGYWLASVGARTGIVNAKTAVQEPGYINKMMVSTVGDSVVVSNDLPKDGIGMDLDHPDVVDRYLVEPVKVGRLNLPRGTLLTSEIVDRLKNSRVRRVVVASPLTSTPGTGLSAKAFGLMPDGRLPQIGDNLGVMAGQSIGERMAQLMLKSKHGGGVYSGSSGIKAGSPAMSRVKQLLQIPEEIPNPATLATVDGKITRVKEDPAGGFDVTVTTGRGSDVNHYVPGNRSMLSDLRVGSQVKKGKPLTDGNVDLRELLDISGVEQVRNQIVSELDSVFRPFGIRRRNLELLARGVTNTGIVEDPGDSPDLIKGQYITLSKAEEINREMKKGRPVKVSPVLMGIKTAPLANTEDWLAKLNHERIRDTVVEAALQGHVSDVSGYNPYSALAYNERFGEGISKKPGAY